MKFTQFLMPDGRRREVTTQRGAEVEAEAASLADRGVRFECEVLMTGEVSFTAEFGDDDDDDQTLAIEVVPNGPDVPGAVDRLVYAARTALERRMK